LRPPSDGVPLYGKVARPPDLVPVVEAAYRLGDSDEDWLTELLEHVAPLIDGGWGVGAFFFDMSDEKNFKFTRPVTLGAGAIVANALAAATYAMPSDLVPMSFGAPSSILSASQALGCRDEFNHPLVQAFGHPFGMYDLLGFKALDANKQGVMFATGMPKVTYVGPREAHPWSLCAAHIQAGLRLRRELSRSAAAGFEGAEAVIEAGGRVQHAEEPAQGPNARDALRAAALAIDEARSSRVAGPEEALELWRGLVAGRWSLIEHFDHDGRRYFVARRNDPKLPDPRALDLRERQVAAYAALGHPGKLIAYELGLSPSAVSRHLTSALRKLGATTRGDLLSIVGAQPDEPVPSSRSGGG
jgi:DNA-binding CsgD family transcriptional regulator